MIKIDAQRFDFNRTGAPRVMARQNDVALLQSNSSLHYLSRADESLWFSVRDLRGTK